MPEKVLPFFSSLFLVAICGARAPFLSKVDAFEPYTNHVDLRIVDRDGGPEARSMLLNRYPH